MNLLWDYNNHGIIWKMTTLCSNWLLGPLVDVLVTFSQFCYWIPDQNNRREERTKEARKEGNKGGRERGTERGTEGGTVGRRDEGREEGTIWTPSYMVQYITEGITEAGGWSSSSHYFFTHLKPLYNITHSYFLFIYFFYYNLKLINNFKNIWFWASGGDRCP